MRYARTARTIQCRLAAAGVMLLGNAMAPVGALAQERAPYEELQTFSAVLNHIRVNYLHQVGFGDLVRAAVEGVLGALDPHSHFVSAADVNRAAALALGNLGTVGLELENVDGMITVQSVVPGSSAEDKGIQPGDRLRAVDDTSVVALDAPAAELRLAGRTGSRVALTLERGPRLNPRTFRVTVKREALERPSVRASQLVDDSTGYAWLAEFGPNAPDQLEDAVRELQRRGAKRMILDLRGNPGGSVSASVEIAGLFLERNALVFRTEGRKRDVSENHVTTRDGRFRDLPLIVLIDERSASASEALAGSLQDHDRALVIGRRSFGKALVQTPFRLPGGDVVWLTVARVLTPSGRFIQRQYEGLDRAQYLAFAGRSGAEADTLPEYRTTAGRTVRGGGGIVPDIELPAAPILPIWFTVAADSGFVAAVADSVAFTLHTDSLAAWMNDPRAWQERLLVPFMARVRTGFAIDPDVDPEVEDAITGFLAERTTRVRWDRDTAHALMLRHDGAVRAARAHFSRLAELLAPPSN